MQSQAQGFTLIELMVVMALAAIVLGMGVPSFKGFTERQRAKTVAGEFINAAALARSEAIKRNTAVGVYAEAGGWKDGWQVKYKNKDDVWVVLGKQVASEGLTLTVATDVTQFVFDKSGRITDPALANRWFQVAGGGTTRCVKFNLNALTVTKQGGCA